ncbi:MAG TPA: PAS domain S-box protein [Longimicrobiaceae bacterium]|nr:PAS domain S-box protein [Longimicrobiaceae bacterium]
MRLTAVRETELLGSPPEESFDRLTRLAARLLGSPVALISLMDAECQYFKSCVGLPEPWASTREIPLSYSFCPYVVESGKPLAVEDARLHPQLKDSPAIGTLGLIAYAGVPLHGPGGEVLGTMCAIAHTPHHWTPADLTLLQDLGATAATEIALRLHLAARRRAEAALRESEERFRATFEHAAVGIAHVGTGGRILRANGVLCDLLGYAPEEVAGLSLWDLTLPEDRHVVAEKIPGLIAGTTDSFTAEKRYLRRDGRVVWAQVTGSRVCTASGEHDYIIVVIKDVTERRAMQEELRRLELEQAARMEAEAERARTRAILDGITDAFYVVDREWRLIYVNAAASRLLERPRGELLGRVLWEIAPDAVQLPFHSHIQRVMEEGRGVHQEEFVERLGRWFGVHLYPSQVGVSVYLRDITEHKQAQQAVREAALYFRALSENSYDLIQVLNRDEVRVYVSPSVERVLGYTPEELLGRPGGDLVHPDDRPGLLAAFRREVRDGEGGTTEVRARHRDGSWRILETAGVNLMHDPVVAGYVLTSRDITERRQAEEALRESQRQLLQAQKMEAVGRLAGGVAHDFNNLLTVIKGTVQLLLMDAPEDDPTRADLHEIDLAANRAAALTCQLLAFSRQQVVEPRVLDLNAVIANLDNMLRRLVGEDVEYTTSLGAKVGPVLADPGQVEQVVLNLVVNSRDAMPQGGRIVVRTRSATLDEAEARARSVKSGTYTVLEVTDTGTGMDADTMSRIWEPFFTTKGQGQGTGLGLSTVYGIVTQSGGGVSVRSEVGRGTTFEVYLPQVESAADRSTAPEGERTARAAGETVLLVEDDEMVRSVAKRILQRAGYVVLETPSALAALEAAEQHPDQISLVLADVVMPQMSGRILADRLRQQYPHLKILFMSGYTDDAVIRHGVARTGAFLQKPFTPDTLLHKVREVLDSA